MIGTRPWGLLALFWLLLSVLGAAQTEPSYRESATRQFRWALEHKEFAVAERLLLLGADPRGGHFEKSRTALHLAAAAGEERLLEVILRTPGDGRGAARNPLDAEGQTPLHLAVREGHLECVRWLLYRGAKVDVRDTRGCSALSLAIEAGDAAMLKHLLAYRPDLSRVDAKGLTPLEQAAGKPELLRMLSRRHGPSKMAELAAWALVFLSFCLPAWISEIKRRPALLRAIWLVLGLHHLVAVVNAYFWVIPFSRFDASAYNRLAWMGEAAFNAHGGIYVRGLGLAYQPFGPSLMLGQQLSILAFLVSTIVLLACARCLGISRYLPATVVLAGALPSVVVFTSLTLTEAWLMLGLLLAVYGFLESERPWRSAACLAVGVLLLGLLHKATALLAPVLLFCGFARWARHSGGARLGAIALVVLVSLLTAPLVLTTARRVPHYLAQRNLAVAEAKDDSAHYGAMLRFDSASALLVGGLRELAMYWFAPFPWQVRGPLDLYAAGEGLLRATLLWFAVLGCSSAPPRRRAQRWCVFAVVIGLECVWAAGTVNWGTALRHHLVAHGLLVLLAGESLFAWLFGAGTKSEKSLERL